MNISTIYRLVYKIFLLLRNQFLFPISSASNFILKETYFDKHYKLCKS